MSNLILLFLCLFLGIFLRKAKLFPENGHSALNSFVVNISLSSLSLYYIPKIAMNFQVLFPVAVQWLNILLAIPFFVLIGRKLKWSKGMIGAVIMGAGLGNSSFIGIPVIHALYGESGMKTVMLVDQPGGFVALFTVGIAVANYFSGSKSSASQMVLKIVKYPPFIAFTIAVLLNVFSLRIPTDLDQVFEKLGATTVPLALVSVGSQLRWQKLNSETKPLILALSFKLLLFPLIIFLLYFFVFNQRGEMIEISFLEAGMAPMITAGIIANTHHLHPKLTNLIIGIGIPISFATLAFWYFVMHYFI